MITEFLLDDTMYTYLNGHDCGLTEVLQITEVAGDVRAEYVEKHVMHSNIKLSQQQQGFKRAVELLQSVQTAVNPNYCQFCNQVRCHTDWCVITNIHRFMEQYNDRSISA